MCHPDPGASPLLQKIPGSSNQSRNSDRGGRSTIELLGGELTCPRVQASSKRSDGRPPDQPDLEGMRKRRAATSVRLTALKPKGARAVDAGKSDHELVLDAYGYGELAQLAWFMAAHAGNALQALGGLLLDWQLGPPVAECAKVAPAPLSPTTFRQKYSKDFQIWLSPSIRGAADLKGAFVFIGEHHFDKAIGLIVKKPMLEFRRTRGDRYFTDGGSDAICRERVEKYFMAAGDCRVLEKDSAAWWELYRMSEAMNAKYKACVDFLQRHASTARSEEPDAHNSYAYFNFIDRHTPGVPAGMRAAFDALLTEASASMRALEKAHGEKQPARDQHIGDVLLKDASKEGVNFIIVGSTHLKALWERFKGLKAIFMVPLRLVEDDPSDALPAMPRDEL